jgi:hypothetical protein
VLGKHKHPKNMKFGIIGMTEEKRVVSSGIWVGFGGTNVEQVCGGAQSFRPEFWWHGRVNEKSAQYR